MPWQTARPLLGGLLLALACAGFAGAQTFTSGSTGADGAFIPPGSVPPGTTVSGSTYTVPLPPTGVFNFTTITIPSGSTVTFARNATNTPAVLLATGDVTLAGILDLNGGNGAPGSTGTATAPTGGLPGPGGFAGGSGSTAALSTTGGAGQGPGAGGPGVQDGGTPPHCGGAGGGHRAAGVSGTNGTGGATCSAAGGAAYGGVRLLPLVGGSGGGGGSSSFGLTAGGGGGGGGALLLASSTKITLTGTIRAYGGGGGAGFSGSTATGAGGGGSGGALRLVAPLLTGSGGNLLVGGGLAGTTAWVSTYGGGYAYAGGAGDGAAGRLRLEATTFALTATMTVPPSQGPLGVVSLPTPPGLQFVSVAGVPAPAAPQGNYGVPDLTLPVGFTNPVTIALGGVQIPAGTVVTVRAAPLQGAASTATGALTGTVEASTASINMNLSASQPTVLTAEATFTVVARAGEGPIYADGEEVTHVKVAAVFGGPSTVTYLTRSGREVQVQ